MTPFYKKALQLFAKTQTAQIKKGLAKYPEPFNPHSWTPDQLLNHALEETVDLTHYLVGLKDLLDERDKEISELKRELKIANEVIEVAKIKERSKHYPREKYDLNYNPVSPSEILKEETLKHVGTVQMCVDCDKPLYEGTVRYYCTDQKTRCMPCYDKHVSVPKYFDPDDQ